MISALWLAHNPFPFCNNHIISMHFLELTSSDDPHILECAVIITDKNLNELERGHWIIHYEKAELEKLSDFHQKTYKSRIDGRE
jgi:oligoribonuclease (3'-5' exoribonuclease)